jgi:AcrR family transcriptional regulator
MAIRESSSDRLPAEARRDSIIQAAWEILREYGLEGLSIEAIVGRVGVSRPIFYRHFTDRTDVLAALYDDYAQDLSARTASAVTEATTLDEVVVVTLRVYFDCFQKRGAYVRALIDHVRNSPRFDESRRTLRERQMKLIFETVTRLGITAPTQAILVQIRLLQAAAMEAATMIGESDDLRAEIESALVRIERSTIEAIMADFAPGTP